MLGPGVPVTSAETFSWLDGGYFLVQHLRDRLRERAGPERGVNYWGYDSDAKRFRIIFFSNNGPFTEEGNRYEGKVAGNKLTFEGPGALPVRPRRRREGQGQLRWHDLGGLVGYWTSTVIGSPGWRTPSQDCGTRSSEF